MIRWSYRLRKVLRFVRESPSADRLPIAKPADGEQETAPRAIRPYYEKRCPGPETILDIFRGAWKSRLPGNFVSGSAPMFEDKRPEWILAQFPDGFTGKRILELGPFEAYQTFQMEKLGADDVTAVEANSINFLKCLCLKEVYSLRAKFLLGDVAKYVEDTDQRYDLIVASGILYHLQDPIAFLQAAASKCSYLFIWTHYFDQEMISSNPIQAAHFRPSLNRSVNLGGRELVLHARSYLLGDYEKSLPLYWEGGQEDITYWLGKDDLLYVLRVVGFASINVEHTGNLNGLPLVSLLATSTGASNNI